MVEGRHRGAAGGRHGAGDLHYCRRLLLIHTVAGGKKKKSLLSSSSPRVDVSSRFCSTRTSQVFPCAHLKLYGHFPPYWSLSCCSWKQLELSSEHGLCSSRFIFSCSPWNATRFQKTKAEFRRGNTMTAHKIQSALLVL